MPGREIILNVEDVNNIDNSIYEFVKGAQHAANGYLAGRMLGLSSIGATVFSASGTFFWHKITEQRSFAKTAGSLSTLALMETLHFIMPNLSTSKMFYNVFLLLVIGYVFSAGFRHYINNENNRLQNNNLRQGPG